MKKDNLTKLRMLIAFSGVMGVRKVKNDLGGIITICLESADIESNEYIQKLDKFNNGVYHFEAYSSSEILVYLNN